MGTDPVSIVADIALNVQLFGIDTLDIYVDPENEADRHEFHVILYGLLDLSSRRRISLSAFELLMEKLDSNPNAELSEEERRLRRLLRNRFSKIFRPFRIQPKRSGAS